MSFEDQVEVHVQRQHDQGSKLPVVRIDISQSVALGQLASAFQIQLVRFSYDLI